MPADSGEVIVAKGKTLGYLAQHQEVSGDNTIYGELLSVKQYLLDMEEKIRTMEQHAQGGVNYSGKCFICHSNCPAEAEATRQAVAEHFPHIQGDIRVNEIGTIIASHCGPGTVAVFFFGDERQPDTSGK